MRERKGPAPPVLATLVVVVVGMGSVAGRAPGDGITDIRYDVTWDRETAAIGEIHVEMSFTVDDDDVVALSVPSWTPGSYELDDFAQNIRDVWVREDGEDIHWDKSDFDTWRVHPKGAGRVTLGFDYLADALDVGSAWATDDFAFFNGTNLFPFPEGGGLDFESEVVVHTEDDWQVATGMTAADGRWSYTAGDYHEAVDMPTFVGAFDLDSTRVGERWYRLATYPAGAMAGSARDLLWGQIRQMMPPMEAVIGEVPWNDYTTLLVFDEASPGGSALEHSNSHLGVYHPQFIGSPILASITAHEIFHAWNVKRIRPADLWPYDYGRAMPTELLWISEGITDYYADLALVRGEIVPPQLFYALTQGKIETVNGTAPVALEDASLSTWIQPTDGTGTIYYPKGSLAGFMLDVLIRDATDNRRSLDEVMRNLYDEAYLQDRGFTEEEWWEIVSEVADGRDFTDFHDAYIDGRDPFPWAEILPIAGLELFERTTRVPRLGVTTVADQDGIRVESVVPGGSASNAGVRAGDDLVELGGMAVDDQTFGELFRLQYAGAEPGSTFEMVVMRAGERMTFEASLEFADVVSAELQEDPDADERARRIREGILTGSTGR